MDMIEVLAQGSMRAAARLLLMPQYAGIKNHPEWSERITNALRQEILSRWESLRAEWKDGLDASIGEGWLREMVNLQCIEIAQSALNTVREEVA